MKALIFSDSHQNVGAMQRIIEKEKDISYIIHAGDVFSDVEELMMLYPRKNFIYVIGNNDLFVKDEPTERFFELFGVKIYLTHGHKENVKYGIYKLYMTAREKGADLVIFGHTHRKFIEEEEGICLFNPGCASSSYGILEINKGKFSLSHINM